jgi:hypothetical protein
MTLDISRLRIGDSRFRIDKFIDANCVQWAEDTMLSTAQKLAWNRGLSENAIADMWIEKVGFKAWEFIWDYRGPNDEPISRYLNDGTPPHDISAKGKNLGGSDWLSWIDKSGKRVFRKKVKHPGTTGMKIRERAWEIARPQFQKQMQKETQAYLQLTGLGK